MVWGDVVESEDRERQAAVRSIEARRAEAHDAVMADCWRLEDMGAVFGQGWCGASGRRFQAILDEVRESRLAQLRDADRAAEEEAATVRRTRDTSRRV